MNLKFFSSGERKCGSVDLVNFSRVLNSGGSMGVGTW